MLEPRRYAEWLHQEVFLPVVVVIGTEVAKKSVREANGLSLAEFLSPFGGFYRQISVSCTSLERPVRIDDFRVRFADAETATQWSAQYAEQVGASLVESVAPKSLQDAPRLALTHPSPWYVQWRLAMFRSLRWSDHEALDQPAAALLVVSSKEPDPVFLLEQLLHSANMPPLCAQGILDPVPSRAAVILHDLSDPQSPSLAELEAKFSLVQARFSPHLALKLTVNNGSVKPVAGVVDLFRPFLAAREPQSPPPPPPPPGAPEQVSGADGPSAAASTLQRLMEKDLDSLASVATEVIVKCAVPWLEQQLQQLENQISQTRKGFRNQLKYLWRKPRESGATSGPAAAGPTTASANLMGPGGASAATGEGHNTLYPLRTVEGQMRSAGDIAFHLRDYEAAAGYYRMVVTDFKQDKAWIHAAGAYEMWGICAYVTGAPRNEFERCMENAYDYYLRVAAGRLAMRAVALHQAMVCDCKESAARLMKVKSDMADAGLRSALLLEQVAQLYCEAGLVRKGFFHMVLAGHTFNKLGFKRLALCEYRAVANAYENKPWFHITDHFQFTMARQAFGLGLLQESLNHFLVLLNSFAKPDKKYVAIQADRESTYLNEFLFVVKHWTDKCKPTLEEQHLDLHVPCIGKNIQVVVPGDLALAANVGRSHGSGTAADANGSVQPVTWEALGDQALKSGSLPKDDRMELQWLDRRNEQVFDTLQRVVAVDTEIFVELEFSNPLRVRLDLAKARLVGEIKVPEGISEPVDSDSSSAVEFPAQSVILEPMETRLVRFRAIPRAAGLLRITRVAWSLQDQVSCERTIGVKGRRLRKTLEQRASVSGVYSDDKRLELRVCSGVPRLAANLEGWSPSGNMLHGEFQHVDLVLRNCAIAPTVGGVNSIRISTSHPAFVAVRGCDVPESNPGMTFRQEGDTIAWERSQSSSSGNSGQSAEVDEVRVPLLVRAGELGRHALRFLLLCEASLDNHSGPKSERRQWIALQHSMTVQPVAACTAKMSPSHRDASRFIISCSIENRRSEELDISGLHFVARSPGSLPQALEDFAKGSGGCRSEDRRVPPGQTVNLLLTVPQAVPALATGESAAMAKLSEKVGDQAARRRLLEAARASASCGRGGNFLASQPGGHSALEHYDLVLDWTVSNDSSGSGALGATGQLFVLDIPRERSGAQPCLLEARVFAPASAPADAAAVVPVTLQVQSALLTGEIAFYVVVDPAADFLWLGCQRSAVVRLGPGKLHKMELQAVFPAPGVFNLNRIRFCVVGLPANTGAPPASEHAPLSFALPFERLIDIRAADSGPASAATST
eukprot:TRINITY_DN7556_c0_g3_i1.p1 TRINITY_DN7556_c0_g3~~TRINITY_DN7556_c0_g3_i1.p1  ORF type:complete len:1304 (-),score=235.85 TRINITY_DN7556_c0_g3_i1:85-3996(-)